MKKQRENCLTNTKMDEREILRNEQIQNVMPLIGKLLDIWDDLPNDVKSDPELNYLSRCMQKIDMAMEGDI